MLLLLLAYLAVAEALVLHHRVCTPDASCPRWSLRATFDPSSVSFAEQDTRWLTRLKRPFASENLYQLALQRDGDASEDEWDVTSIPACYLNAATTERITLVSNGAVVYTFHYQVEPSPSDGICSERDTSTALNTTLSIVGLRAPPSPELRTPPPLTPQGQPVVPIPEKTFIQKYWMYIVLFLGIMLFTGGAPEEGQGGQGGS